MRTYAHTVTSFLQLTTVVIWNFFLQYHVTVPRRRNLTEVRSLVWSWVHLKVVVFFCLNVSCKGASWFCDSVVQIMGFLVCCICAFVCFLYHKRSFSEAYLLIFGRCDVKVLDQVEKGSPRPAGEQRRKSVMESKESTSNSCLLVDYTEDLHFHLRFQVEGPTGFFGQPQLFNLWMTTAFLLWE